MSEGRVKLNPGAQDLDSVERSPHARGNAALRGIELVAVRCGANSRQRPP